MQVDPRCDRESDAVMTAPEQFAQDSHDLVVFFSVFWLIVIAFAWFLERRARRRREPEVLPAPDIPSYRNVASLEEWRRKYQRLNVEQIDRDGSP